MTKKHPATWTRRRSRKSVLVVAFTEGNAIGTIERPERLRPNVPLDEQYMVNIGVMHRDRPCSEAEFASVIDQVKAYCVSNLSG